MLPHPLHLLLPLPHIVFRSVGIIHLLQFLLEQDSHLILIPLAISIEIVHHEECLGIKVLRIHVVLLLPHLLQLIFGHRMLQLIMLPVLGLQLLHFLLNNFPFLSIIDGIQSHILLKLLLHFILFEIFFPLLVLLF